MIQMSSKELRRLPVLQNLIDHKLTQVQASEILQLSIRHTRRIQKRFLAHGEKALTHARRGKPSNNRHPDKERILTLYHKHYPDFGPTLAVEKLLERHKITLANETLRLWLIQEGLWQSKKTRKNRLWRQRRACLGEMLQMDGSHHDWFEGRGPKCVLIGYIDDATNRRFARFYEYEGVIPAMDSLMRYIRAYGIPQSIYLDRHSTYRSNAKPDLKDDLNGTEHLSQFERASRELGIRIIHAQSAPAKGRIERDFKTYQDRLVKEMRLEGIRRHLPRQSLSGGLPGRSQ